MRTPRTALRTLALPCPAQPTRSPVQPLPGSVQFCALLHSPGQPGAALRSLAQLVSPSARALLQRCSDASVVGQFSKFYPGKCLSRVLRGHARPCAALRLFMQPYVSLQSLAQPRAALADLCSLRAALCQL